MSSKKAYYFHKNFNWKEVNNLFAYDVKHPERLSKRQQILRLYKNCSRRLYELEMLKYLYRDLHGYADKMRGLREDFETLKYAKTEQEVDEKLEKYEQFIEYTYQVTPWVHDNVSYEWRHAKGLPVWSKEEIETDLHGYYDRRLLDYYPKALEWQYRDEYPWDDVVTPGNFSDSADWQGVDINDPSMVETNVKTPEQFQQEVEQLKQKYALKQPDMWQRAENNIKH